LGLAHGVLAQPAPGPWDRTFDWVDGNNARNRNLKFCVDPNLAANLKASVRKAVAVINAAGTGWKLTEKLDNMNKIEECPMGWSLRPPFLAGQAEIRVRQAVMPVPPQRPGGRGGNAPSTPYDRPTTPSYDPYSPYDPPRQPNPNDQPPRMPGMPGMPGIPGMPGPPAGGGGTLAYFQAGPAVAGRLIRSGEIVFNAAVVWNTGFGTAAYDPIEVAMHEFGHAIRMDHDSVNYNDDDPLEACGSRPAPPANNPQNQVSITRGNDGMLQTPVIPDDGLTMAGDITVGNNLFVDSGKKMNVMEPEGVFGEHCINRNFGVPANVLRAFTAREKATAMASAAGMVPALAPPGRMMPPGMPGMPGPGMPGPAMPGPHILVAGGLLREMDWLSFKLQDASGTAIVENPYFPGFQDGTLETDYAVDSTPDAPAFFGSVIASSPIDESGKTTVDIEGQIGSVPVGTTAVVQFEVPFSPDHPSLRVVADWAADKLTVYEGPSVLCAGPLTSFHPVDCAADPDKPDFFSAGLVQVVLTKTH
jgi:hypothetical protein